MFSTGIIVFREVLEAALIISIIAAATRGVAGRTAWIAAGVGAGLCGATVVAGFTDVIADFSEGRGQEIFNASVLLLAVLMLAWHNIWMAAHARKLAGDMKSVGTAVSLGERGLWVIAVVVGLAVLREGSEVVLFAYGIAAAGAAAGSMAIGGLVGLACGVVTGYALYAGLLRIPVRHFFTVTGWMILLLAAGLASSAAGYLLQAGLLPALGNQLWDSSGFISSDSAVGEVLHILVGYEARPAGIQLVFYVSTLVAIGLGMLWSGRRSRRPAGTPAADKQARPVPASS